MPRYLFTMYMDYNTASNSSVGGFSFYTYVTGYNADCDYSVSRDEIIGYSSVIEHHPDSSTVNTMFGIYENGNEDLYLNEVNQFPYNYITKRGVLGDIDYINSQLSLAGAPYIARPYIDRRNMRGRVLRETTRDVNDNMVRDVQYTYSTDAVHLNQVWWNDLDQFDCSPWTCYSPLLASETITDYADDGTALTTVHTREYNATGQVCADRAFSLQAPGDTVSTYFQYYNETQELLSGTALPGALRRAVRTRSVSGGIFLTAAEQRDYSEPSVHIQPSAVTTYQFGTPLAVNGTDHALAAYSLGLPESTAFTRDSLFRIIRADLPGGAWVEYDWDGNDIIRVRQNDSGNQTQYSWKPLVGVTEIIAPSGQKESADYDTRNRLWRRKDTAGRVTESYQYKLKNE